MKLIEESVRYDNSRIRTLHTLRGTFDFNWHCHDEYEISLVRKGAGTRYTGDRIESFHPPEMIFIPPRLPHTWQSSPEAGRDNEVVLVQFRRDFSGADAAMSPELRPLLGLLDTTVALQIHPSEALIADAIALHHSRGVERLIALLRLLVEISAAPKVAVNDVNPSRIPADIEKPITRLLEYIQQHATEDLSIPDLASRAAMSESSLRRHFKRATAHSIVDYILHLRIARACELLTQPSLTINEVGSASGFSNLAYFNRRFKELQKMTPTEYRKRHGHAGPKST